MAATAPASRFTAPKWVHSLYSRFPLVVFEQEDEIAWKRELRNSDAECSLWVHRSAPTDHPHYRSWASSEPDSLRAQLLFLLRRVPVTFKPWTNEQSAPKSKLPALHLIPEDRLLSADEIRSWLDSTYPSHGKNKEIQNMPSQESYDRGVALAQLVLGDIHTAYLSESARSVYKQIPNPPPLAAGLKTPLPAAFTGDGRSLNSEELIARGEDALDVLSEQMDGQWALGAGQPTPLDALIAAHLYAIYALKPTSPLRRKVDTHSEIGDYLDRVLTAAGAAVRP